MHIGLIGAGSWGTSLAILLAEKGSRVHLWVRRPELLERMLETSENTDYLPGRKLPEQITLTYDLEQAVSGKDVIVLAVPSHAVEETVQKFQPLLEQRPGTIIVNTAKGLAGRSHQRLSQVILQSMPQLDPGRIAVLSGPNHAEEVSRGLPTATVVASTNRETAETIQDLFMAPYLRVYTNPDIVGVELGGALKNIIAIGAGVCEGLNFGDNTKAALLTRGLVEITRLGLAMGAQSRTFSGLTGVGDLFVTCSSTHSRNRYVGLMLGQGKKLEQITASMKMVAEGIETTRAAHTLSRVHEVEMPITREVYGILFEGIKPQEAVINLMKREKTKEIEEVAFD